MGGGQLSVAINHKFPSRAALGQRSHTHEINLKIIMSFFAGRDVIRDVFAIQRGNIERAFAMLFSRSFLVACIDCKEIAAFAS